MLLDCTDRNEKWYCQHDVIVTDDASNTFCSMKRGTPGAVGVRRPTVLCTHDTLAPPCARTRARAHTHCCNTHAHAHTHTHTTTTTTTHAHAHAHAHAQSHTPWRGREGGPRLTEGGRQAGGRPPLREGRAQRRRRRQRRGVRCSADGTHAPVPRAACPARTARFNVGPTRACPPCSLVPQQARPQRVVVMHLSCLGSGAIVLTIVDPRFRDS